MGKVNGIKLCYLYIVEKNMQREICLDNELSFSFKFGKLTIRKKDNYIENFYGRNINNFNLIIGKNGVGKTTLLRDIINSTHSIGSIDDITSLEIKIVKKNGRYLIFHSSKFNIEIDEKPEEYNFDIFSVDVSEENYDNVHFNELSKEDNGYQSIFFTNQFSESSFSSSSMSMGINHPINLGLKFLLRFPDNMFGSIGSKELKSQSDNINLYDSYIHYCIARFLNSNSGKQLLEDISIPIPPKFLIKINGHDWVSIINERWKVAYIDEKLRDEMVEIIKKLSRSNYENIYYLLVQIITDSILSRIDRLVYSGHRDEIDNYNKYKELDYKKEISKVVLTKLRDLLKFDIKAINEDMCFNYLSSIKKDINSIDGFHLNVDKRHRSIYYEDAFEEYNELVNKFSIEENIIEVRNRTIVVDIKKIENVKEILYYLSLCIEDFGEVLKYGFCFNVDDRFSFSSGEECILSMFSRIQHAHNKIVEITKVHKDFDFGEKKCKSLILFFDEPDIYMHPEWKRRFIQVLVHFIEIEFPEIPVQIILTTNSPILAGDILAKDTIVLKSRGELGELEGETFSKNLMLLFKDAFFMSSLLGEFSKEKIEKLINDIKNKENNKDNQMKLIEMIAEPTLKRKVKELYYDVYGQDIKITEREKEILSNAKKMNLSIDYISQLMNMKKDDVKKIIKNLS